MATLHLQNTEKTETADCRSPTGFPDVTGGLDDRVHSFNPSTEETEAGGSESEANLVYIEKIRSPKTKTTKPKQTRKPTTKV